MQAAPLDVSVLALHVHHGLSANADAWLDHARSLCARWARRGSPVELVATRLAERPLAGQSVEAWARRSRYRALREMALARGVDLVLLAHHRRDQAETFLLQALRGGGVAALSADEAADWMVTAVRTRPIRIAPRKALALRALDVVAPGTLNAILEHETNRMNARQLRSTPP